jgi:hypothetical protein
MHRSGWTPFLIRSVLVCSVLVALIASGCGYRSQLVDPRRADRASDREGAEGSEATSRPATRIAVLALRNDSPEPWLDRIVTDAVRREISSRGGFRFVDDPQRADLVLRGRIRPLGTTSRSFSRFVAALEYGVTLQLDLEVVLAGGDVVRLDSRGLSESDVYLASADIEVTRTNRLEVLRRLSDLVASRVADSIELIGAPLPDGEREGSG